MPKKILLADDSITIQKVVELTFSDGDYEVTAVNNGAKAVQKLAEMRPDIILSDIIMPEKNGYEVCEYVKSHPEYRNIPVVLLTGTFEPFDPDRAEKAGCDAVVTKPFESQSLIHKVEELISQSQQSSQNSAASTVAVPIAQPAAPSPWMEEPPAAPEPFTHDADIFGAAPPQSTTEMPFEVPQAAPSFGSDTPFGEEASGGDAFAGETRAFPRMSFEDMQQMASASSPEAMPVPEPSPWDEPASTPSFSDFAAPAPEPEPEPIVATEPEADPFGASPAAEEFSSETRAIPKMTIEELRELAAQSTPQPEPPAPEPTPAPSPWDEQEAPAFGGETRAFPKMNFDDFQQQPAAESSAASWEAPPAWEPPAEPAWEAPAFTPAPEPADSPFASEGASPFGEEEAPAYAGETRAFPKMNFDDFQGMTATPEPGPEPEVEAAPVESFASPIEEEATPDEIPAGFSDQPMPEEMPFSAQAETPAEEPSWLAAGASEAAEAEAEPEEPAAAFAPPPPPPPALAPEAPPMAISARSESADLTDEQVDRIARRVVELLSDQVVRNIAWEVIPDLAEMVVKERIRQLEAEA
ncbi:MAG TPA: response regulator [Thermoanaerobaculia bacterium]|nr:response regulator [Thermoanaerobaculia bacterium]